MADTKLTNTKIPTRNPQKKEKLGLLTSHRRKMISYRMRPEIIELLHELTIEFKKKHTSKMTKSDLIEMALHEFSLYTAEQKKEALVKFLNGVY